MQSAASVFRVRSSVCLSVRVPQQQRASSGCLWALRWNARFSILWRTFLGNMDGYNASVAIGLDYFFKWWTLTFFKTAVRAGLFCVVVAIIAGASPVLNDLRGLSLCC